MKPTNRKTRRLNTWAKMLAALRFALPYMEDLAYSSSSQGEQRAAQLMREAIAEAELN
jgi:hypothetical protein